ncbi:MAG: hypothetical protein JWP95_473 [Actinotalea sp.]|nr:hypothetical protein [Actinotalea sp.]
MTDGPFAEVKEHVAGYDLLRRAGRPAEAAVAYRAALELVTNEAERDYLERRLAEVVGARADVVARPEHVLDQPFA